MKTAWKTSSLGEQTTRDLTLANWWLRRRICRLCGHRWAALWQPRCMRCGRRYEPGDSPNGLMRGDGRFR
jgi:hypothetical protein